MHKHLQPKEMNYCRHFHHSILSLVGIQERWQKLVFVVKLIKKFKVGLCLLGKAGFGNV